MTTVALSTNPLPPSPQAWASTPSHLEAYNLVLKAESHANEQVQVNPNPEADDRLMSARIAGYLLLELFERREILSDNPCASLVSQIISTSRKFGGTYDAVFGLGEWHRDRLIRMCALDLFPAAFGISVPSQFIQLPKGTLNLLQTLHILRSAHWKR